MKEREREKEKEKEREREKEIEKASFQGGKKPFVLLTHSA
jgi:hypothetical protein